jgi:hypothetical protein
MAEEGVAPIEDESQVRIASRREAALARSVDRSLQRRRANEHANCNKQFEVPANRSMNYAPRSEKTARHAEPLAMAMVARNVADAAASAIRDLVAVNVGLQRLSPSQFERYRDAVRALDQLYLAVSDGRHALPASASSPKH